MTKLPERHKTQKNVQNSSQAFNAAVKYFAPRTGIAPDTLAAAFNGHEKELQKNHRAHKESRQSRGEVIVSSLFGAAIISFLTNPVLAITLTGGVAAALVYSSARESMRITDQVKEQAQQFLPDDAPKKDVPPSLPKPPGSENPMMML